MSGVKRISVQIEPELAKEIALAAGEIVANCKCHERLLLGLGLCKWCADEAIRDCNYIDNALDVFKECK